MASSKNLPGPDAANRAEAFRRKNSPGRIVSGRVASLDPSGLAWIDFDGDLLLADVGGETAVGRIFSFRILRLTPEIVLKVLPGGGGEGPEVWASRLIKARTAFESAYLGHAGESPADPAEAFAAISAGGAAGLAACLEALALEEALNASLGGGGTFRFLPWLIPGARNIELFIAPLSGGQRSPDPDKGVAALEAVLGFDFPRTGRIQARIMLLGQSMGFRLLIANQAARHVARRLLDKDPIAIEDFDVNCLGVAALPAHTPTILGSLMAGSRPGPTILSARV